MVLWACPPPRGTLRFPPSLRRSTASKCRFLDLLEVPWLAQHNHPYTSPTRGRVSSPRGSGTAPQSRSHRRPSSAPCAGPPRCPCACGADAAPRPPSAEAIRAGSALGGGGGWLVLGSWGLGGDVLAGVRVDVVEVVVVVVVVVVGVVCRHLLDAGGDAPHRLHVRLRGRPALCPPPSVPSSPLGSQAPSRLSLGARGALALALGPLSSPLPVSRVPPPVPHALAHPLTYLSSPCPLHLGSLPVPLRALPVPWPLPGPLPRVAPSAACALLPPAAAPFLDHSPGVPLPLGLAWAWAWALPLPTAAAAAAAGEASVARAGFFPRLRGVLEVAAWPAEAAARPAGAAVATPRAPSSFSSAAAAAADEAPVARAGSAPRFCGVLGVATWSTEAVARPAGTAVAIPHAPSSLPFAAVAAADEAPVAHAGSAPCFRGVLGVAAWSVEAVVRPAGAAVAIPRAPFLLSSAAAAALGDAPGSCAGAAPRVGGVPGAAVWAAAWLAGAAVSASCASGAPSQGRGGGAGCLGGGGGHLGWLRLPGRRRRPDQHRRLRQPPLLALREGLPRPLRGGGGGAGAGPAVVAVVLLGGPIGVCHLCYPGRHAWLQARPSHYLLVHQCRAVGSAVWRSAGGRGGGGGGPAVASAPHGRGPAAIHRHWEGRWGSHAAHASRHSSHSGAGPRALGPRGSSSGVGGSCTRWTPVTAVTSCVRRKVCTPSGAAGARRGGRGTGVAS